MTPLTRDKYLISPALKELPQRWRAHAGSNLWFYYAQSISDFQMCEKDILTFNGFLTNGDFEVVFGCSSSPKLALGWRGGVVFNKEDADCFPAILTRL
eukprot:5217383-Pyramimonas_sp.AAC.2